LGGGGGGALIFRPSFGEHFDQLFKRLHQIRDGKIENA
jgi:hypothetical protein